MDLSPGTRVDRYVLIEPLGEGGQGAVWKARDPLDAERPCALKLVPASAARPADLERARREARALSRLEHPSLVHCHALFEDLKLGVLGIAMEWVDGTSLKALASDPRLDVARRHDVLLHVARALAYLHDSGVVHRDVKLENVLVQKSFFDEPTLPDGVKLVDLGIASVSGNEQLTAVGTVVGTVPYLAPELVDPATFDGDASSPTIDVFAFGVMSWLLLSGRHPTGLPPKSSFVDYTRAYRAGLEPGHTWPEAESKDRWSDVLGEALCLTPANRIRDGRSLVARLEGRSALPGAPTSVASPRAMRADTELHPSAPGTTPPSTAAQAAATVNIAAPKPEAKPRSSGVLIALGTLGLAVAVGFVISTRLNDASTTAPSGTPSARAPSFSAAPIQAEPREAAAAEPRDAEAESTDAIAPALPFEPCDAGCTSGRGCGDAGCSGVLDVDEGFTLRAGGLYDQEGRSLIATYATAELCVAVRNLGKPPTCTKLAETQDGGVPAHGLYVETPDLTARGIDVELRLTLPGAGSAILAEKKQLRFADGVLRSALCKGLDVELAGDADVQARARFYLDDADPKLRPTRCP